MRARVVYSQDGVCTENRISLPVVSAWHRARRKKEGQWTSLMVNAKSFKKVTVYHRDGTPLKPIKIPIANARCQSCRRKIRFMKAENGAWLPVEEDLHIVNTDVTPGEKQTFLNRKGEFVHGQSVDRGWGGCILGFKVHSCHKRRHL